MDGIELGIRTDTLLAPGETVVVVKNATRFSSGTGAEITPVGQYSGSLQNGGERITLDSPRYGYILNFEYSDLGPWPGRADGGGSSLELIDPDGNYGDGANWRPSSEYGGSPNRPGDGPIAGILINEVLTRPDGDWTDAIELYNPPTATWTSAVGSSAIPVATFASTRSRWPP